MLRATISHPPGRDRHALRQHAVLVEAQADGVPGARARTAGRSRTPAAARRCRERRARARVVHGGGPSNSYDARLMTTRRAACSPPPPSSPSGRRHRLRLRGHQPSSQERPARTIANGAKLFAERCAGCHTLDVVGAQGGATEIHDRERVDGPNFNVRRETTRQRALRDPQRRLLRRDHAREHRRRAGGERRRRVPVQVRGPRAQGRDHAAAAGRRRQRQRRRDDDADEHRPRQDTTSTPEAGTTSTSAGGTQQATAQGKQVFTQNCGACHTLKDANTTGRSGRTSTT